jgi:branched-chain amino acid transport system permease protein
MRQTFRLTYFLIAVIAVVAAVCALTGSSYSVYVLDTLLLAAIGAVALDLLMGTGGQVSIGNAAFLAAGAFSTVWALRAGILFPFDVIIGAGVCAVAGLIVGLPALRIKGMYLALATLAAFYIAQFIGEQYQSDTVGAGGFLLAPVFAGTLQQQQATWAWLLGGVLIATIIVVGWLRTGRSGRAWRMIRDHEVAAAIMGIPVARYKLILFVITSAVIGLEGGLLAEFTGAVSSSTFTLDSSISVIAMILIGGLDSQAGPLIGAIVVTMLPIVVPDVTGLLTGGSSVNVNAGGYAEIVYGVLIMVFIIAAPGGISGLIQGWVQSGVARVRAKGGGPGPADAGAVALDGDAYRKLTRS